MNKKQCTLLIIVFAFITFSHAMPHAYPQHMQFKHITPDNGLSSSTITCFLQDYKGFMWIGTYFGLNRYDGYDFIIYSNSPSDSTSLINNFIYTLHEDRFNNLWIGTAKGLSLYDWNKDQFINFMATPSLPLYGYPNNVFSIAEDTVGNLWLATDQGLVYYDRIHQNIISYQYRNDQPGSLSNNYVEYVFIDSQDRLWVSTRGGLNLFDSETRTFFYHWVDSETGNELSKTYFIDIVEDSTGNLWIGTLNDGIYKLKITEKMHNKLFHYYHKSKDSHSLSTNRIQALFVDQQGQIWVGTESGGLNLYNPARDNFWQYRADELNPNSLNNESIYAIYQDNTSNLWIGTFAGGINIPKIHSNSILDFKKLPGVPSSLSNNSVTHFLEDHLGRIWVATDGGGMNLFEPETGQFKHFNSQSTNLNSDAVLCMIEDSDHQIWIGTWGGGLNRFNPNTASFQSFTTKNSGIQDNYIISIIEGNHGDLWLASFNHGLIHFQKGKNRFINYNSENSGLNNNMLSVIDKMNDGRLLIGTPSGFDMFNPENQHFQNIHHDPRDPVSISANGILDFAVENDTIIWIGTHKGLNRFDLKNGYFRRYCQNDGLPDDVIKGLVFDMAGRLWVTTNRGLVRFDTTHGCNIYTKEDGLQSVEFNNKSTLCLKNGCLLLGGTNGFNMLYPDSINKNTNIPRVLITDFRIFNKPVPVGIEGSPLKKHITESDAITLSYTQSTITFEFAVMDFTIPEKNQYAYRMDGLEKEWNFLKNRHAVTYTMLDPGNYTFRVIGSNNDGLWNTEGVSLKIKITPPFWKTWWFVTILILIICGSIYCGYELRLHQMRQQRKKLELLVKERTQDLQTAYQELKVQKQQLEMNTEALHRSNRELEQYAYIASHDLQEPLRMISSYLSIIKNDYIKNLNDEAESLFNVAIDGADRMRNLIHDLLLYSKISTLATPFSETDCESLLSKVLLDLKVTIEENQANITHHPLPVVMGDPIQLERLFQNLIENAIKYHGDDHPEIYISNEHRDGDWLFSIKDNGIGIEQQYQKQIFGLFQRLHSRSNYPGTGIGLAICQKIVEHHGGKIWVESDEGKGSTFFFTLSTKGEV